MTESEMQAIQRRIERLTQRIDRLNAGAPTVSNKNSLSKLQAERAALMREYEQAGLSGGFEGGLNEAPDTIGDGYTY